MAIVEWLLREEKGGGELDLWKTEGETMEGRCRKGKTETALPTHCLWSLTAAFQFTSHSLEHGSFDKERNNCFLFCHV